jgi:hypothetical protein
MSLSWRLKYMGHSYGGNEWAYSYHTPIEAGYYIKPFHGYSGRPKAYTWEECAYITAKKELPSDIPEEWIDKIIFGGEGVLPIGADNVPLYAQGHCQAFTTQKVYCVQCDYSWFNLVGGETGCVYFEDGHEYCPVCGGNTDGLEYDIVKKLFYPNYYR